MENESPIYKLAYERAIELFEGDKDYFDSIDDALDIAFEEIIDECKYFMHNA